MGEVELVTHKPTIRLYNTQTTNEKNLKELKIKTNLYVYILQQSSI